MVSSLCAFDLFLQNIPCVQIEGYCIDNGLSVEKRQKIMFGMFACYFF